MVLPSQLSSMLLNISHGKQREKLSSLLKPTRSNIPNLRNTITNRTELQLHFDVTGEKAWIVEGEDELFGEIWDFYYVISDATGQVEYTFNHHGRQNPHLT